MSDRWPRVYRRPNVVDRLGNSWSLWPWVANFGDGRWGTGYSPEEAVTSALLGDLPAKR